MAKRSLREIARDMRAAGEMLLEGANEIEQAIAVDFTAVAALLGGEPVKAVPFVPSQQKLNGNSKLTAEQKAQIKAEWQSLMAGLPKQEQTKGRLQEEVRILGAKYQASNRSIAATIFNNPQRSMKNKAPTTSSTAYSKHQAQ